MKRRCTGCCTDTAAPFNCVAERATIPALCTLLPQPTQQPVHILYSEYVHDNIAPTKTRESISTLKAFNEPSLRCKKRRCFVCVCVCVYVYVCMYVCVYLTDVRWGCSSRRHEHWRGWDWKMKSRVCERVRRQRGEKSQSGLCVVTWWKITHSMDGGESESSVNKTPTTGRKLHVTLLPKLRVHCLGLISWFELQVGL